MPKALMSMKNILGLMFPPCSLAMMASLMEYMQQTPEQYSLPTFSSLEPTHCMNAIFSGMSPSEGLMTVPKCGPVALSILSNSMLETTFWYTPYPYSALSLASNSSKPGDTMIEPTLISKSFSF